MVGPQNPKPVSEILLEQGDCLTKTTHIPVGACEVVARGECVGVVGAQDCAKLLHSARERYSCLGGSELYCVPQSG